MTNAKNLGGALEKAFAEDNQVLVEEFISGREFTVGVYKTTRGIVVFLSRKYVQQILFDYKAKYHGESEEITPAEIPAQLAEKIRSTAKSF